MVKIAIKQINNTPASEGATIVFNGSNNQWSNNDNNSILVPSGTTAQRPTTPANGHLRYNTDLNAFEVFENAGWRLLTQNVFETFNADTGTTTADLPSDTLIVAGGSGITTALVGDTLTITNISPGGVQDIFQTINADVGTTTANTTTDTLTVTGGANITTSIVGDVLTIDAASITQNLFETFNADVGTTTANISTDTLIVSGGTAITTAITGDTLTINNDAPNIDQNLFLTFNADGATTTTANTTTDALTISGGTGITTTIVGDVLTIDAAGGAQNLFETFNADVGTTTANITTDTLTVAGGTAITTAITGDTLTINNDSPNIDQNLFETVTADTGSTTANTTTDTLTVTGAGGTITTIVGDTLTIDSQLSGLTLVGTPPLLYVVDPTRANKNLSVNSTNFNFANNSINNNDFLQATHVSDITTGIVMPFTGTVVYSTGHNSSTSGNTKDILLLIDALPGIVLGSFTAPTGESTFVNTSVDVDFVAGAKIRLQGGPSGGRINDTLVTVWVKWRV